MDLDQFRLRMYTLDDHGRPVACADALTWAKWMQTADRHVAQDMDEGDESGARTRVSTIFLGIDHGYSNDLPPLLWETMVFGGVLDRTQDRYCSLEEAIAGHQAVCARVRMTLVKRAI